MFCSNCGSRIHENSVMCSNCGHVFTKNQNSVNSNNQEFIQNNINKPVENPVVKEFQTFQEKSIAQPIGGSNGDSNFNFENKSRKNLKNIIIGSTIVIALIVVGFVGSSYLFKNGEKSESILEEFDMDRPIKIQKDNLYGYIDTNGKVLIEPRYTYAKEFNGNYANVSVREENGDRYYAVVNKKGEIILKTNTVYINEIEYVPKHRVWVVKNRLYDENLKPITPVNTRVDVLSNGYLEFIEENSVGIMDHTGKKTYSVSVTGRISDINISSSELKYPELKDEYCSIDMGNREIIVNCKTGKVVLDYHNKSVRSYSNNVFRVVNEDSYDEFFYIANDKIVYKVSEKEGELSYVGNGVLLIESNSNEKYYDINSKKLTPENPKPIKENGIFERTRCHDWRKITIKKGDEVLTQCWNYVQFLPETLFNYFEKKQGKQLVIVGDYGKTILYDIKESKIVAEFNNSSYHIRTNKSSFLFQYQDSSTYKINIYNVLTNKSIEFDDFGEIELYTNYFTFKKPGVLEYYNTDFKLIYTQNLK